jgi:hypothetical protein
VALTASVLATDVRRVLAAGCDAHLAKPLKKATLLAALARFAAPGGRPEGAGRATPSSTLQGRAGTRGARARPPPHADCSAPVATRNR